MPQMSKTVGVLSLKPSGELSELRSAKGARAASGKGERKGTSKVALLDGRENSSKLSSNCVSPDTARH